MTRAMTTQQAGVVDVVLSNFARGYSNQEFIAGRVFPIVDVPARNMRLLKFGKEGFRKLATRRAPGAPILTVQYGYASDPVSLAQDALQGVVPVETQEEASRVPASISARAPCRWCSTFLISATRSRRRQLCATRRIRGLQQGHARRRCALERPCLRPEGRHWPPRRPSAAASGAIPTS